MNDRDATIILEDNKSAFLGGGMHIAYWYALCANMYFWLPKADIEVKNRSELNDLITSGDIDADYILSTHDLTDILISMEDIIIYSKLAATKNDSGVYWHIYKVSE